MNKIMMTTVAAIALLLGGAAFAQAPTETAPSAVPAPAEVSAAPATGKGHIYFFRPGRLVGGIYTYNVVEVGDDGHPAKDAPHLAELKNGGAASVEVEPGIHSYNLTGPMAAIKDEDRVRMEVEPGQTYYLEQTVRIGVVTGGFRLVPADEARFKASKVKLAVGK